ncbi:hypothetical protein ACH42_12250 [Endozoicomonas sp. (ex Bugula neritina AB1)]|nr:hypothetical protein ACH42_12250 [Endozoicomonas sp. (ex Bugula neritina AB1)]
MEIFYSFAGLLVGFIVGLTGIGGGALMTPILIMVFGIPPIVAVSTDLLYASITKCGGMMSYAKQKLVDWRVAMVLLAGSIPGSLITLRFMSGLEDLGQVEQLINLMLGVSLILTSIAVFLRDKIRNVTANRALVSGVPLTGLTILIGLFLGGMVTLSSVGAGALGTALLIVFYPRMPMAMIIGTDLVHAVVLTGVAAVGHYQMDNVNFELLQFLLIGGIPGALAGSYLGTRLSPNIMQPIMGALLLIIGLRFMVA